MATLILENVPEKLIQALGQVAEQGQRSLNAQALYWLEQKADHWSGCQERENTASDVPEVPGSPGLD